MTLDVLFTSIGNNLISPAICMHELAASDRSESQLMTASTFLESIYGDGETRANSRAQTPLVVSHQTSPSKIPRSPAKIHQSSSRFHLSKIYSSFIHQPVHPRMPGEYPPDPLGSKEHIDEHPTPPVTGFAKISKSVVKLTRSPSKEATGNTVAITASSRRNMPRASTLPQLPDIGGLQVAADASCDHAIIISMYEVYNDRIFDLLTGTGMGSKTPAKEARRRPLLFKCTEHSPDRKVVAGLRKVVCGSLEEALLVLETGLTERRVAGTGSNAVSSRSHGFFCIDVKKKARNSRQPWQGATMTIVDLAGSERARTAKTAGTTLAEAGKINESLMYLGQCMQMQSDNAHLSGASDPHLVPFRQCKLTELLFSNVLTQRGGTSAGRNQQKATMIVTADPGGDFNATSQILRYSALAREVTVPRIPSVTQSIIYPSLSKHESASPTATGRTSPTLTNNSVEEIAMLQSELEVMRLQLAEETERRRAAEESWALASSKTEQAVEEAEAVVRAECMDALDQQLAIERARWADARDEEREANERLIDEKVDLVREATEADEEEGGGVRVYEDSWKDKCTTLARANEELIDRLRNVENELRKTRNQNDTMRTPSRKLKPLKAKKWVVNDEDELVTGNDENATMIA